MESITGSSNSITDVTLTESDYQEITVYLAELLKIQEDTLTVTAEGIIIPISERRYELTYALREISEYIIVSHVEEGYPTIHHRPLSLNTAEYGGNFYGMVKGSYRQYGELNTLDRVFSVLNEKFGKHASPRRIDVFALRG